MKAQPQRQSVVRRMAGGDGLQGWLRWLSLVMHKAHWHAR